MFKIDTLSVAEVLAAYQKTKVDQEIKTEKEFDLGEPTEFKCECGGIMHKFDATKAHCNELEQKAGKPRHANKKRQIKKNYKKWKQSDKYTSYLCSIMVRPLRNPQGFKCALCGKHEGFYSMMGKNIFKIESI